MLKSSGTGGSPISINPKGQIWPEVGRDVVGSGRGGWDSIVRAMEISDSAAQGTLYQYVFPETPKLLRWMDRAMLGWSGGLRLKLAIITLP
jgi:hypothetical protein